jgi:hypothetical protein
MVAKLTKRQRDTILAALRRWLSYPAAREADTIATNGGKHKIGSRSLTSFQTPHASAHAWQNDPVVDLSGAS